MTGKNTEPTEISVRQETLDELLIEAIKAQGSSCTTTERPTGVSNTLGGTNFFILFYFLRCSSEKHTYLRSI